MKTAKTVTNGLALMLAVFILLFLATQFLGYHPSDDALKKDSKLNLFFDQNEVHRDYLRLFFLLCISAAAGLLFDKLPELGVLSALFPLGYALLLLSVKRLTKHPMVIVSLCLAHLCGAVVWCGYQDRKGTRPCASNASLLCSLTSLGLSGYVLYYQSLLRSVSEELAALKEAEITVSAKVRFVPDLIRMVAAKLKNFGASEARDMLTDFGRETDVSAWKIKILDSVTEDQFANYLRLAILLFGTAVLIFALRRWLKLTPALLSALPFLYAAIKIHADGMSALSLPILTASLFALVCGIVAFDQHGKRHDPAYDEEPTEEFPSDDPDETYYT